MDNSFPSELMVYKSPEDISDLRDKVLSHIEKFEIAIKIRTDALRESKQFLYFEKDVDHFSSLLDDLIEAIPEENIDDFINIEAKMCKHQDIEAEISAHEIEMVNLEQQGLDMIRNLHRKSHIISKKIHEMKDKWQALLSKLADQIEILRAKQYYVDYTRGYDKITRWINKKTIFLTTKNNFKSLESLENYIYDFSQMERKMQKRQRQVEDLKSTSDFFIKDDLPQTYNISQKKKNLGCSWEVMKDILSAKRIQLLNFMRIHKLCCRVDEFLAWMAQKDAFFSNEDCGSNLEEHLVLLKKHEGMERLICGVVYRLREILQEYDSLHNTIQAHTEGILVEKSVIEQKWRSLEAKALKRGMMLRTHSKMQKFFIDINCSIQAIDGMKAIISTANDIGKVEDADVSLQMLAIYRDVIELNEEDLDEIVRNGQQLLQYEQKTNKINEKLEELKDARRSLKDLLDSQEQKYKLLLALQIFNRDCESALHWLEQKTSFLEVNSETLETLDIVQESMRNHEMFKMAFLNEKKRIENLIHTEIELGCLDVLEAELILQKQKELKAGLETLEYRTKEKSKLLLDTLKLQLFHNDCDDVQQWIVEKLKLLCNDHYLDVTVISTSIAEHNLFVNEFSDYSTVICKLVEKEKEMIEIEHYAVDGVRERVKKIVDGWNCLSFETYDKTLKLDEILESQNFLLIATKLQIDLAEFEDRLSYQYVYHDGELSRALQVERNLEMLEQDVNFEQRRLDELQVCGNKLIKNGHFDSNNIAWKMRQLKARHCALVCVIKRRKEIIEDARAVGELYIDIEDQIVWMRQTISNLGVINTELGLLDVQHLISKYKTNSVQFTIHRKEVRNLCRSACKMIKAKHYDSYEIRSRMAELLDVQKQMRKKYTQFKLKLEEARCIYDYYMEVEITKSVMQEKRVIMNITNFGENEDSSAALLKRHETLIDDLKMYGRRIEHLRRQAEKCKKLSLAVSAKLELMNENNVAKEPEEILNSQGETTPVTSSDQVCCEVKTQDQGSAPKDSPKSETQVIFLVMKKQLELEKMYDDLMEAANIRKNNLVNTLEAYVLMREANALRLWVDEKVPFVQQTDVGEDVVQMEVLQKAFDDFKSDEEEKNIILTGILTKIEKLLPLLNKDQAEDLSRRFEDVEAKMKGLQELARKRELQLRTAHELQRFYKNCDEAEEWVKEKDGELNSYDYGDSLRRVRALLRKHEGLERDLDAIDERINELEVNGKCLLRNYPESSKQIKEKQSSLNRMFAEVSRKAVFRKQNLLDSYDLQKFYSDYDDLMSWMDKMMSIMSSKEGAKDYHDAEHLRDYFERMSSELEDYEMKIRTVKKYGEMLMNYNTGVKETIEKKLEVLKKSYKLLYEKRNSRQIIITKNLQIHSFIWNCERVCYWMVDQEKLLNTCEEDEKHLKTLRKIKEAVQKKEKDIDYLDASAQHLVASFEEDKDGIIKHLNKTVARWENLKEAISKKLSELKENQTIQNFTLEVEAVACWIDEKVQQVLNESQSEPVRIQSKLMRQKAFESEVNQHSERVKNLLETGHDLIRNEKSEKLRGAVLKLLNDISEQWFFLQRKTKETGDKIEVVSNQYEHIMGIKYMNIWMSTVETTLMNKDLGKNLNVVEELLKQHVILEEEIGIHKEKMEALLKDVDIFKSDSIFDVVSIKDEHELLNNRFERIEELAEQRKSRLKNKVNVLKYLRSVEEQEAWLKEISARFSDNNEVDQLESLFSRPKTENEDLTKTIEDIF